MFRSSDSTIGILDCLADNLNSCCNALSSCFCSCCDTKTKPEKYQEIVDQKTPKPEKRTHVRKESDYTYGGTGVDSNPVRGRLGFMGGPDQQTMGTEFDSDSETESEEYFQSDSPKKVV